MLRKVLIVAAAFALPLTGLAVWGSTQLATAVAAPPFNCPYVTPVTVTFGQGAGYSTGLGQTGLNFAPGLALNAGPAATVHSANGALLNATTVDVTDTVVKSGGVSFSASPAIVGQSFKVGKGVYTITRVDNYLGGKGLEQTAGHTLLTFTPKLAQAILAGGAVPIQATTLTTTTLPYVVNDNNTSIAVTAGFCTSNQGDFYPDSFNTTFSLTGTSDAAASLGGKSLAMAGTITWPPTSGHYQNPGVPDTVSFGAGAGAFCEQAGEFDIENGTTPISPATDAGANPCTQGEYYYVKGHVSGTYATTQGSVQIGIASLVVCTEKQLQAGDFANNSCEGQSGNDDLHNGGSADVTDPQTGAGVELQNVELYEESNGDCFHGGNGWAAGSCNPPSGAPAGSTPADGGDGSPIVELMQLNMAGQVQL